jgi:hypothetical protein
MEEFRKPRFSSEGRGFVFLVLEGVRRVVYKKAINLNSAKDLR